LRGAAFCLVFRLLLFLRAGFFLRAPFFFRATFRRVVFRAPAFFRAGLRLRAFERLRAAILTSLVPVDARPHSRRDPKDRSTPRVEIDPRRE
jgi:hypothetical protein